MLPTGAKLYGVRYILRILMNASARVSSRFGSASLCGSLNGQLGFFTSLVLRGNERAAWGGGVRFERGESLAATYMCGWAKQSLAAGGKHLWICA